MRGILSQVHDPDTIVGVREDARIAEQQFGNFQNVEEVQRAKAERRKFGRFFYRFPSGEAGLDVYSRVTSFMSTLYRDSRNIHRDGMDMDNFNLLIVTHGLTLRLMLMRWLQISVEDFEQMYNPDNAFWQSWSGKLLRKAANGSSSRSSHGASPHSKALLQRDK